MKTWIRTQLRELIIWALAGAPEPAHDAAGMDKLASGGKP